MIKVRKCGCGMLVCARGRGGGAGRGREPAETLRVQQLLLNECGILEQPPSTPEGE